ncbi:ATP-binding protein IstB (plasmid) [Bacillus thuringiensis serovar finitimus YBT-020]|nr:ATP-binding protein IstB [Bacillus thuringiensis serovar finitimus YBT-020]
MHQNLNNEVSFVETLVKLTNYEIDVREQNMIHSMVKMGAFPHRKEVDEFDFEFQPSINKQQILDFISLRFLEQQENIVFLGPSGVGKTHLATSIGIAAAKKRIQNNILSKLFSFKAPHIPLQYS